MLLRFGTAFRTFLSCTNRTFAFCAYKRMSENVNYVNFVFPLRSPALEHQAEIHSCDTDFGRFAGSRWRNPLREQGGGR